MRDKIGVSLAIIFAIVGTALAPSSACKPSHDSAKAGAPYTPGQIGPFVIPATWRQPNWYIDPLDTVSGACASDNNRTCGVNNCATAGDGPCLTFGSVATRWGTYEPRLQQVTTISLLSAQQASANDLIYLDPKIEGANVYLRLTGTRAQAATGTLGTVTAKSRSGNQLLQIVLAPSSGAIAVNQLLVNTTHSGEAWIYSNVSGNTWLVSQPLATASSTALPPNTIGNNAAEQDSFTAGDSYVTYTLPTAYLIDADPVMSSTDTATAPAAVYVDDVTLGTLSPSTSLDITSIGAAVVLADVFSDRVATKTGRRTRTGPSTQFSVEREFYNCDLAYGAWNIGDPETIGYNQFATALFYGGILNSGSISVGGVPPARWGYVSLNQDIIAVADDHGFAEMLGGQLNDVYATGIIYVSGPTSVIAQFNAFTDLGTGQLWGPGALYINGGGTVDYGRTPSTTAVATFLQTATHPLAYVAGSTACSSNSSAPATMNCGIPLTPTNMDAAEGSTGFGGYAFVPGYGAFHNQATTLP
jgi:hypothetical protein